MSIYMQTVPQFINMLKNLENCLKKAKTFAEQKKFDVDTLFSYRLAPDMFPLVKQIQVATDMAKGCCARITGQQPPRFEDNEKTFDEVIQRLRKTISYLETFKPGDFDRSADIRCTLAWAPDKAMKGGDYVNQMMLPNFYFHASMTYALLRHVGVDVGKSDFIGEVTYC